MLLASDVNELVIELEARDGRDVGDALWKADMVGGLSYRHETHRAEPILWLADAVANDLPLYTCNAEDFAGVDDLDVIAVPHPDNVPEQRT